MSNEFYPLNQVSCYRAVGSHEPMVHKYRSASWDRGSSKHWVHWRSEGNILASLINMRIRLWKQGRKSTVTHRHLTQNQKNKPRRTFRTRQNALHDKNASRWKGEVWRFNPGRKFETNNRPNWCCRYTSAQGDGEEIVKSKITMLSIEPVIQIVWLWRS